jgi:hypothetical protein
LADAPLADPLPSPQVPAASFVVRYRPRAVSFYVPESEVGAFEQAMGRHGFRYSSRPESSSPKGPRWFVYNFDYKWHQRTLATLAESEALHAELNGLGERFRFRVELRR